MHVRPHRQTISIFEMQLILTKTFMQVHSINLTLYQSMASEAAVASLNLTSVCIVIEKLSKQLQGDVAVEDICVDALTGSDRALLLSQWPGELA